MARYRRWTLQQDPLPGDTVTWDEPARIRTIGNSVFVLDLQARQVAVLDTSGAIRQVVGGPGEGPGEMQEPAEMVRLDRRVFVLDRGRGRILHLDASGRLVGETRLRNVPMALFPAGSGALALQSLRGDSTTHRRVLLSGNSTGATGDTVGATIARMTSSEQGHLVPEGARPCVRWDGWDSHVARISCYLPVMDLFLPSGDPFRRIRLDEEAVRTGSEVLDSIRGEVQSRVAEVGLAPNVEERVVQRTVSGYRYHRRFRAVRSDPTSELLYLWEQGPSWIEGGQAPAIVHVFRLDGSYLERMEFATRWVDYDVGAGRLYAVTVHPTTGLRSITAWRLPRFGSNDNPRE